MLGTLGEGEEAREAHAPAVEAIDHRFHQPTRDSLIPQIDAHGEWTEERETAPAGGEVRADDLAVEFGAERRARIGVVAGVDIVAVAEHLDRVRGLQVGPEGDPQDPVGVVKIAFLERADLEIGIGCHDTASVGRSLDDPFDVARTTPVPLYAKAWRSTTGDEWQTGLGGAAVHQGGPR